MKRANHGMALVAVLWLVAAMSILVMGATATVKQHIQVTGQVRDQVSAQALAEAATALALQELLVEPQREPSAVTRDLSLWDQPVSVTLTPLSGWINLNAVNDEVMARVFIHAANLPAGPASALAAAVIEWRDQRITDDPDGLRNSGRATFGFESVDDLMLVPGMSYDVLALVKPLLVTDLPDSTGINMAAAPPPVLAVMTDGNASEVNQILRNREQGSTGQGSSGSDYYRVQASVPLSAGKMLLLTQDVVLGRRLAKMAPWRVIRTSRQIQNTAS